jgi:hypothetical protein
MTIRSQRECVTFKHPFWLRGIDRLLPARPYNVVTDKVQIKELSFAAFRRVAAMMKFPAGASSGPTTALLSIGPVEPLELQRIDVIASDD